MRLATTIIRLFCIVVLSTNISPEIFAANTNDVVMPNINAAPLNIDNQLTEWKTLLSDYEQSILNMRKTTDSRWVARSSIAAEDNITEVIQQSETNMDDLVRLSSEQQFSFLQKNQKVQHAIISLIERAANSPIFWDQIHECKEAQRYLSPVYRKPFESGSGGEPGDFLGRRIQFATSEEWKQYAGLDAMVGQLAGCDSLALLEYAVNRKDIIPSGSVDVLISSLYIQTHPLNSGAILNVEAAEKLRSLLTAKNPAYRLMALQVADKFESDPSKRLEIYANAAGEKNQIFWKIALQKLKSIGGIDAKVTAEKFRLKEPLISDGTAFSDDANVKTEFDSLVDSVK